MYLPALREELSQGDVVLVCPISVPGGDLRVARRWSNKSEPPEQQTFSVYAHPLPPGKTYPRPPTPQLFRQKDGKPEDALVETSLLPCVVVSHDCVQLAKKSNQVASLGDLAKSKNKPWHVVPLRPWPSPTDVVKVNGTSEPMGELIAAGRFKRYLEMPEVRGIETLPRSYLDFNFLTAIQPSAFKSVRRVVSMTDVGRVLLSTKVFTFFSGLDVERNFRCPGCGIDHSVAEVLTSMADETDDDDEVAGAIAAE